MQYRREVDGLRAVAVLPVILFHAGFDAVRGGFVGVDVFFVISGYLITSILLAELRTGSFTLLGFYERRARRILPALFFVILACLPFAWFWLLPSDMKEFSDSLLAVTTFVSNVFFWQTSGYFDTATELKPLLHTWSLAVEEQYYLFFPLFLMVAWRLGTRAIVAMLAAIGLASLALAQWGTTANPDANFYLLPTRAWELLIGALAAFRLEQRTPGDSRPAVAEAGSAAGLAMIVAAILVYDHRTPFPSLYALLPTVGAVLVILYATPVTVTGRLLGSQAAVGVGLISYSAYLWHQPLFAFARHQQDGEPSSLLMAALSVATLGLAWFSWRVVETPFRNRQRVSRKRIFQFAAFGSAGFLVLGAAGTLSTGFAFRYPDPADRFLATLQMREVGLYVERRFNDRLMKPLDASDGRRKVLLIGDSFAQDVMNVLHESSLADGLQVSTRHISHRCGALWLPRERFAGHIDAGDRARCGTSGLHEDAALRRLVAAADEIWFAARWQPWQAVLVPESVAALTMQTGKVVRVFGTKEVGRVDIKALLALPRDERLRTRGQVGTETLDINSQLRNDLPAAQFVDVQTPLCGTVPGSCRLFDREGVLLSHDGRHLTPPGARWLGRQLAASGELQRPVARPQSAGN
jgi:peptidoglycan/LPS O-acetylase OafA/YrhL